MGRGGRAAPAPTSHRSLVRLRDGDVLLRVRVRDGVVACDVECGGEVDRRRHVRVDQRHRRPFRKRLTCERIELLACERTIFQFLAHGTLVCEMSAVCCAFAYAIELSERTFAAIAALIGAATFALISDIAARSGSSSPASASSSSRVSCLYSSFSPM